MLEHLRLSEAGVTNHEKMNIRPDGGLPLRVFISHLFIASMIILLIVADHEVGEFTPVFEAIVCASKHAKKDPCLGQLMTKDRGAYGLDKQMKNVFPLSKLVNDAQLSNAHLIIIVRIAIRA